jgi:invasion protein IalB
MNARRFLGSAILCLGLLMGGVAVAASDAAKTTSAAESAEDVKAEPARDFSDWRLLCSVPDKGGKRDCQMIQRIMRQKTDKGAALVTFVRLVKVKDKDSPMTMMRLVTPMGTILTPGMAIKVDAGKEITAPYWQCRPKVGCLVDLAFDKAMVNKLKEGKAMMVAYRAPDGKTSTVKVSLKGFSQALDAMTQSTKG